jgi:hypothetical protein
MMELNRDVLLVILENLQDDRISLYSCLLVNRSWCEATVPILWKFPGQTFLTERAVNILFNVILSHLSEDTREAIKKLGFDLFTEIYQTPSFNYIYFWRCLNLQLLEKMFTKNLINLNKFMISIAKSKILKLFVNENTKFTLLFFPFYNDGSLNYISWNKQCFSDVKFFYCYNDIGQNILNEIATVSKSIKILNCDISKYNDYNIYGIIRLIKVQKNLNNIRIKCQNYETCKVIEESLIKKADTVQILCLSWVPEEKFFSHFKNLKSLEIHPSSMISNSSKPNLEKISLPALKILKVTKLNFISHISHIILLKLIESTNVQLTVISISDYVEIDSVIKRLIQVISQNCPNLEYIKLPIKTQNLAEFKKLLINCQHLIGLEIESERNLNYKNLFEILNKSSPSSLFKFNIHLNRKFGPKYKLLRSFFANWKNRHTMLLHIQLVNYLKSTDQHIWEVKRLKELIEYYEAKGIVKKIDWDSELDDSKKTFSLNIFD